MREAEIRFSLKSLLVLTLGIGTWLGLVLGQPQIAANLSYFLLMILLAIFLLDPWLPLLEQWQVGESADHVLDLSDNEVGLSQLIRKFERVGWIILVLSFILVGWRADWSEAMSDNRSVVLLSYMFLLCSLLVLSALAFWIWSLIYRLDSRPRQVRNDLLCNCLTRFQVRGWLILVSMFLLMGIT